MTNQPLQLRWTEEMLGTLTKLHSDGWSATLISRELNNQFGTSLTRNAVIGAAHRAKLPKRISLKLAAPPKIERRKDYGGGIAHSMRADRGLTVVPLKKQRISEAPFLGIALLELEAGQCRYPRGDNPILFCGQPTQKDSSYCPHCHSIMHEARK